MKKKTTRKTETYSSPSKEPVLKGLTGLAGLTGLNGLEAESG